MIVGSDRDLAPNNIASKGPWRKAARRRLCAHWEYYSELTLTINGKSGALAIVNQPRFRLKVRLIKRQPLAGALAGYIDRAQTAERNGKADQCKDADNGNEKVEKRVAGQSVLTDDLIVAEEKRNFYLSCLWRV